MKKIISLILSLFIITGTLPVLAESKINNKQSEALEIMKVLGFINSDYSEETIDFDGELTRAEFADIAGKIFNVLKTEQTELYFHDIPKDYYAYESITYLTNIGAINGNGNKEFHPDNKISVLDASKIILYALGYNMMIDAAGGYPSGVTSVAGSAGLYENLKTQNGNLTYGGMVQLLYNAVTTEILEISNASSGYAEYENMGNTFLSKNYDIYFEEGTVTAVDGAGFYDITGKEGQVVINETVFEADGKDYSDFLGLEVRYLYRYDKKMQDYILLWMKDNGKNEVLELSYVENFVEFDRDTYELSYINENGRSKSAELLKSIKVIYNDRLIGTAGVNEILESKFYTVKLFKLSDGNKYDMAVVKGYNNYIVDMIDAETETIYDKKTGKAVNFSEYKNVYLYNADGSQLTFEQLPIGTVLSVYESYDKDILKGYVSPETKEGILNSYDDSDGRVTLNVDGDIYDSVADIEIVNIGGKVKLWIDACGYVAALDYVQNGEKYAYLIRQYIDEDAEDLWFKLFLDNGSIANYKVSNKVKIDAKNYHNGYPSEAYNYLGGEFLTPQIVRVKFNDADEVVVLDTVAEDAESHFAVTNKMASRMYKGGKFILNSGAGSMLVNSSTIIFRVPSDLDNAPETDFSIIKVSSINDWRSMNIEGYSAVENPFVAEAVLAPGADMNNDGVRYLMVDKVSTVLNSDDEAVTKIEGYYGSNSYTVYSDASYKVEDVKCGDVIRLIYDNKGDVVDITRQFRLNESNLPGFIYDHANNYNFFGAYVYDTYNGMIKVSKTASSEVHDDIYKVGTVWIFDSENNEVRKGGYQDLVGSKTAGEGTPVIIYTTQGYMHTTYAFK